MSVSGRPHGEYREGIREELQRCGHGPVRTDAHLELFEDLCACLDREHLGASQLFSNRVPAFLEVRRRRGYTDLTAPVGIASLLGYLVGCGAYPRRVSSSHPDRDTRFCNAIVTTSRSSGAGAFHH